MRLVILLLLLAFPLASASASELYLKKHDSAPETIELTAKQLANKYFENCMKKENEIFSKDTQEMMCACTAANLSFKMSAREIKAMNEDDERGQRMRNKMLLEVYAPCIEFPTHDLVYKNCIENDVGLQNKQAVCGCMAEGMADYMSENAQVAIVGALQRDPNTTDPLRAMLNNPAFEEQGKYYLSTCVQEHEFGYK